jgi:O-antigen/teichoic acid export membrane protein
MKSYAEENRIRPDILTSTVLWSAVIMMVFKIIGNRIYGDLGSGFSAAPFAFFYIFYTGLVLAVQKAVWLMVRIRARRSQFINAEGNMRRSFRLFLLVGIIASVLLVASSYVMAKHLFGSSRGYLQFMIVAACVLLISIQGVIRGYLQGLGYTKPIVIADPMFAVTSLVLGTVISLFMYSYGLKVNELFHVKEYSAIYGAYGAMFGVFGACVIGLIQILISYSIRKTEITQVIKSGAPRYLDNKNDVLSGIRVLLLVYVSPALMCLLNEILYMTLQKNITPEADLLKLYGILSGKIFPVVIGAAILCCIPFVKTWNRVMARIERDEFEVARDRLKKLIKYSSVVYIPMTVFVLALSETVIVSFFGKSTEMTTALLTLASSMICLVSLAVTAAWFMSHMGKPLIITISTAIGWGVYVAGAFVFIVVLKLGLYGIVLTNVTALVVYNILSYAMIFRVLRYRQELVRTFLLPLAAAAGAGLIAYLFNMIFVNLIGDILTFIICIVVFFISYMMMIIVLRRIKTYELRYIPLGFLFSGVSSRLQPEDYEE